MDVILGIDTSNYRTSLCLINLQGSIVAEEKQLLMVGNGKKGLQQSEALFQHVKQLPLLAKNMAMNHYRLVAVAVSRKPRPVEGSYMPVFLAGETVAEMISHFQQIPLFYTTHQEGHIAAGEYTLENPIDVNHFLVVHLSGGTSEVLDCRRNHEGYEIQQLGGTKDLHAGQLIDRVGVALGLPLSSGPYIEEMGRAIDSEEKDFSVPSSVNGYWFSFSGPEAALLRAHQEGVSPVKIARGAESCIANTIEKVLRKALEEGYSKDILIVGGVAANSYLRNRLIHRLSPRSIGARLYFADPHYSGDNAFGVARIGLNQYKRQKANVVY
ncbi:MAG TPA: O-sialoglycoprotein endopeptidase [Paenibacillaceae bacterium]|nr:O-sialoglycoprotein endopeptidase [Paenibacillaceae bacterium]